MKKGSKINVRVRLIIINNRKVLVQYRQKGDFYHYIGGHGEYGETIKEASEREVREECGDGVTLKFGQVQYIRDFILPEFSEHGVELFIVGSINKAEGLEGRKDPQHPQGDVWLTWLDIDNLPDNLMPKTLSPKLLKDFDLGFPKSGEYVGKIE